MNGKISQLWGGLLIASILAAACQSNQPVTPPPTPTFTTIPSPTIIRLPPDLTATPTPQPTPTNTLVVQASYTPKPPTDTPTPRPEPTATPTSEPSAPEPSPGRPSGSGSKIDWEDADGQPVIISGEDEGYFIWTDEDQVFIRAATRGERYTFSGQVTGDGSILNVNWFSQESMDVTVGEAVNQVDFQWAATGGPEGLDFIFTGDTLLLNLRIEDGPELEPDLVFVGEDKRRLNSMSLQLVR